MILQDMAALLTVLTFVCGSFTLCADIGFSISNRKLSTFPQLKKAINQSINQSNFSHFFPPSP